MIGIHEYGHFFREIAAHAGRNITTVMSVWKRWTKESQREFRPNKPELRQWDAQYDITTGRQTPHLHGSDGAYDSLPCGDSTLEHGYMCITDCRQARRRLLRHRLHSRIPMCRIFMTLNYGRLWSQCLSNKASGVLISNQSSS